MFKAILLHRPTNDAQTDLRGLAASPTIRRYRSEKQRPVGDVRLSGVMPGRGGGTEMPWRTGTRGRREGPWWRRISATGTTLRRPSRVPTSARLSKCSNTTDWWWRRVEEPSVRGENLADEIGNRACNQTNDALSAQGACLISITMRVA